MSSRFIDQFKTIPEMLERTARVYADREAYKWFEHRTNEWVGITWRQFSERVMRWRKAFAKMGLQRGARVAMLLPNSVDALTFDMAALCNALVPVPLHATDTAGNSNYILNDSGAEFLVTVNFARWNSLATAGVDLPNLRQVVLTGETDEGVSLGHIPYCGVEEWLATGNDVTKLPAGPDADDLAALVYTSGTTGRPKGVMLTHRNVVSNVQQISRYMPIDENDVFLSYLPLSHSFERSAAYYHALATGALLAFSRGVAHITDDLHAINPTNMCSVPRVFERIHNQILMVRRKMTKKKGYFFDWAAEVGWRRFCKENGLPVEHTARECLDFIMWPYLKRKIADPVKGVFGNRINVLMAGGAALNLHVAKFFCGMGAPIRQAYGLTESSPVISMCEVKGNHPSTVGKPLIGIEARLGELDELQVRGPQVMKGYWNREEDTRRAFTEDGWLRTGDQADLSDGGRIRIKGRIKEIIVTSVGEKVSPVDLEFAILEDPLFDQVMVVGENRPYVAALVVLNNERWRALCADLQVNPDDPSTRGSREVRNTILKRVRSATKFFPRYGQPRNVAVLPDNWTTENGLLTTTMKLRRRQIAERYAAEIEELYKGHGA